MTRIIVHAGFHKTGTTSLQDFLSDNRDALASQLAYYGKADFLNAGADARIYAQRPYPWRLWRFRRAFRRFLTNIPDHPTNVLSRETFSGGMPGHRRVTGRWITSYGDSAETLARVIVSELQRRFGDGCEIVFFYTLREREDWLRSVHGHLLRSIRLTDDFPTFAARFAASISPATEADALRRALAPIPVVTAALEDWRDHPEGPAGALLDLLDVPDDLRATLTPATRANAGQSADLREAFLALNRSETDKSLLRSRKAGLLDHDGTR